MTPKDLKKLQNALHAEKQMFLSRLNHQIHEPEEYRAEILNQLTESEANLLAKIELALEKIDHNRYGVCSNCGEEIPLERLQAKPSVSLCLPCQNKHEHVA